MMIESCSGMQHQQREEIRNVDSLADPLNEVCQSRREHKQRNPMTDLYPIMKRKAYRPAETIIAPENQGETCCVSSCRTMITPGSQPS
jgi:hypothetical protein